MRRTMANLEFVEAHSGPNGPYEATQLIDSFLGALAHPWETMGDDLPKLPLREARSAWLARGYQRTQADLIEERHRDYGWYMPRSA